MRLPNRPETLLFFSLAVATSFSASNVKAQVAVRALTPSRVVVSSTAVTAAKTVTPVAAAQAVSAAPGAAVPTDAAAATPEKSFDERRLEALLAASIDRSLPTVLKAWSTKDEPEGEKAEKETKKQDQLSATVANIYEDFVILEFEKKPAFKKDDTIEVHLEEQLIGSVKLLSVEGKKVSGKFLAEEKPPERKPEVKEKAEAAAPAAKAELADKEPAKEDAAETAATEDPASDDKPESTTDEADPAEAKPDEAKPDEAKPAEAKPAEVIEEVAKSDWSSLENGAVVAIKKPGDDTDKKAEEEAQIKEEVAQWSRIVTLGKWDEVKSFLATLKEGDSDKLYGHLLTKLAAAPGTGSATPAPASRNSKEQPPSHFLSPEDILQLTDAAPKPWKVSVAGNKKFKGLGKQVAGKWKGKVSLEGAGLPPGAILPEIDVTLDIQLDGKQVRGTMEVITAGQSQSVDFDSGQYDSESGSLTFSATQDGNKMTADMMVDDGNMTGVLSNPDNPDDVSMRFDGELVEPADQFVEDDEDIAANGLPAGVELPPGVDISTLPPEALEQLKQQAAANGGATATTVKAGQSHIPALARLVKKSKDEGFDFSSYVETIKKGASGIGGEDKKQKLIAADLLLKASMVDEVEQFLPTLPDAIAEEDVVSVMMWSQLSLKKYRSKQVAEWLNRAWDANTALSVMEKTGQEEKDAAMANMIELSSKIDKELGEKWLDESFTDSPERGMKILTNLGTKSSTMARQAITVDEGERLKLLRLQNGAVEKLLKISPDLADEWSDALTLLADNWLKEADISVQYGSSNSSGGRWTFDNYGNSYFSSDDMYARRYGRRNEPQPIRIGDVLEIAPGEQWRKRVRPTLKTQMQGLFAKLHLHVNEEDKAFPWIEKVATQNPKVAKDLVQEFLRIWTKNHNPNDDKQRRNPYIYFYGFDQKADAIPLTRSKQQRNLEELQGWVDRIRAMDLEDLDEKLLADAFTTCHSSAEVYDLDRVKSVFGDLSALKPKTIAAICEKMRSNLGSNWRDIRNQEEKKTNRRQPEVQKEVLRGYSVAIELANEAIKSSPDNWQLHLALACLMFDENAYSQTVQKTSEFSDRRDKAFEQFKVAADKYAINVMELEKKDQKTNVYDRWFYASLGAVDLGKITNKTSPVPKQYSVIRDSIKALPGTLSDTHMAKFANNMFTRMSPIKPEVKFRYLRGGFEIVEDHPRAWEARGLYDYYQDLVSELNLVAEVDGSHEIGSDEPFGVYVNLMHTQEIERESGGFGKYVQNQNNMMYAFNYGRPTEDYRDKFNDAVNQALEEHFEIQSVTFISPEAMQSRPTDKEGWRITPYAYLLLKSRGSEVDRLPPLKLDMDFLDTSGYAVIPIESPAVVVDATKSGQRPVHDLEVTQTLDERQAAEGKLIVEITATGKGLVPPIEDIVNLERGSFEVANIDDQGLLPARFDKDSDDVQIISERSWSVEYQTKEDQANVKEFSFGDAKLTDAVLKYQRYEDVDLVDAEQTVSLERRYSNAGWGFLYWLIPLIVVGLFAVSLLVWLLSRKPKQVESKFDMPEEVNPFTVLTLLRDIRQRNGISNEKAVELENSILEVERSWFGKEKADPSNLEELAKSWLEQAS